MDSVKAEPKLPEDEMMKAKAFMIYQYWLRESEAAKVEYVKSVSLKIRTQKIIQL